MAQNKQCSYCGTVIKEGAKFCTQCGKPLEADDSQNDILMSRCPKCGYTPSSPSRFCIRCGESLVVKNAPQQQAAPGQTPPQDSEPQQQAAPSQTPPPYAQQVSPPPYQQPMAGQYYPTYQPIGVLQTLCSRLRVSAVLLLITGIIQAIGGVIVTIIGIVMAANLGSIRGYVSYYGYYRYYQSDLDTATAATITCLIMGILMLVVCVFNFVGAARTFSYIKQIQRSPMGIVQHFAKAGKTIALLVLNILCGGAIGIIGSTFALAARSFVQSNAAQFVSLEQQVRNCSHQ